MLQSMHKLKALKYATREAICSYTIKQIFSQEAASLQHCWDDKHVDSLRRLVQKVLLGDRLHF